MNWETMTPELPRAPKITEEAIFLDTESRSTTLSSTDCSPLTMVVTMLVPVSPSGTGNTLS